jgi:DNA-binding MarR family transcriptional regulator
MSSKSSADPGAVRRRRRLGNSVKESLRELNLQLSLLNSKVSARLDVKDIDLDCMDLIARYGPLSPSALARRAALHPATVTGILDRLERNGWIARERDPSDRRSVLVRTVRDRTAEVFRLYAGMNAAMDEICGRYDDAELEVLADFLRRTIDAGRAAADDLAPE